MATITNFAAWIDGIILETQEEADDLINSVRNVTTAGDFTTTKKKGMFFVTGPGVDTLPLASEKARSAFIAEVERIRTILPDDLEVGFQRNMGNPHA